MEKLQPILTHKFWIVFGLALILPPVGWWGASGDLSQKIESRTGTLDTLKVLPGGKNANQQWIDEVKKWNEVAKERNQFANLNLWTVQKHLMVWPDDIRATMATCKFRQEHDDAAARSNVPSYYVDDYPHEVRRVWRIVEPVSDEGAKVGKLKLRLETIPQVPASRWKDLYPSWPEIWDAQEDLWLVASLFQVIRNLNEGALSIGDSNIREISQIRLFGGTRKKPGTTAGPSSPKKSGPAVLGQVTGGFGDGSANRRSGGVPSADFPLTEEFSVVEMGGVSSKRRRGGLGMPKMGRQQKTPVKKNQNSRYVDFDENLPYRVRGFYLKVVMDHRRLPDLLAELSEIKYPIEVIRVHQSTTSGEKATSSGGRGSIDSGGGGGAGSMDEGGGAGIGGGGALTEGGLDGGADAGGGAGGDIGAMSAGSKTGGKISREVVTSALGDENLTTVVIAGLMTLYNPVEIDEQALATGQPNASGSAGTANQATNPVGSPQAPAAGTTSPGSSSPATTSPSNPSGGNSTAPPATNKTQPSGDGPSSSGTNPASTPGPSSSGTSANPTNPNAPPSGAKPSTTP